MIRLEIIANNSVEENILDAFKANGVGKYYTKLPGVHGIGTSGPRMGDPIWPEENFVFVIWCEEEEALGIKRAIEVVKEKYPNEGIKMFGLGKEAAPKKAKAVLASTAKTAPAKKQAAAKPAAKKAKTMPGKAGK